MAGNHPAVATRRASAPRVFVVANFVMACCWNVPRQPQAGETLQASGFLAEPGGKGLNVAIGLARLGCAVQPLIGCGQDAAADHLSALLAAEGLADTHVHRLPAGSGCGAGLIGDDGQNAIAVFTGANAHLTAAHAEMGQADIAAADLVYGQFETALAAVVRAFELAHAAGRMAVLNPSPWQEPPASLRQTTHTLIVSEVEAHGLLDLRSPLPAGTDAALQSMGFALPAFWHKWPAAQVLVVTLGGAGSVAMTREGATHHAPPFAVQAVDTLGCGDAFAAGFCDALLHGHDLPTALRLGNGAGAWLAQAPGVLDALPRKADLLDWLARQQQRAAH